jgi:cell division protein FtsI/penicillin-binding protein 2
MRKGIVFILTLISLLGCREAVPVVCPEVYSTTLEELQQYGDSLMQNKVGAIVAIDPSNGEILAMVSSPRADSGLPEKYQPGLNRCTDVVYPVGTLKVPPLGLGEADMHVTPLQLANACVIIANQGLYYVPHTTREVNTEGDPIGALTLIDSGIAPERFHKIIEGMWLSTNSAPGEGGRGWIAHVDGLNVCGMPGKARNPYGEYNSVFIGFAPKNNPRIAIAVYVENGGVGAAVAAPIGSLMIEKYLLGQTTRHDLESRVMKWYYLNRGQYKE